MEKKKKGTPDTKNIFIYTKNTKNNKNKNK